MAKEKKGVMGKVVEGLVESTKMQHQITKERHIYAKKSPIEKQQIQLAELQRINNQ